MAWDVAVGWATGLGTAERQVLPVLLGGNDHLNLAPNVEHCAGEDLVSAVSQARHTRYLRATFGQRVPAARFLAALAVKPPPAL